jgi:hypothetical protein
MGWASILADSVKNPFTSFLGDSANAIRGVGVGLASGTDLNTGMANAAQYAAQGAQKDDAFAIQKKDEAERQRQITEAAALKDKYANFFMEQNRPDIAQGIADGIVEPGAAYMDFIKPKAPQAPISVSPGETLLDPVTMQPVYSGAPDQKDQFGYEKDLYSQYFASDPVKQYQGIKGGYEKLQQAAAQGSGPGDMSLIFGFMKMLDPTSTVREGEYASAQNSGGIPAQIQGLYNKAIDGQFLTEAQRQEFLRTAEGIYQETVGNLEATNAQFSERAGGYGVDPKRFIVQPESFKKKSGPVSGTTSTGVPWSAN